MGVGRMTRAIMAGLVVAAAGIAAARAEVLIGLGDIQTGRLATPYSNQLRQAAELAVAKLNAEGGVLGQIGFDDKGDITGVEAFVWYVWQGDTYVPASIE